MEGSLTVAADPKAGEVQRHFEVSVGDFDSIYTGRKGAIARWLDRTLRRDMFERFDATIAEVQSLGPHSRVLDVGCGNGIYAAALAQRGATVLGVDFSKPMIDLAVARATTAGVWESCDFVAGDFLLLALVDPFDCSIAIGVFDYLAEPQPFLDAMRRVSSRRVIATFPCRWTYRAPIRRIRLGLRGCPVYFYSERDVRALFSAAGMDRVRIERMGHIYFAVGECD